MPCHSGSCYTGGSRSDHPSEPKQGMRLRLHRPRHRWVRTDALTALRPRPSPAGLQPRLRPTWLRCARSSGPAEGRPVAPRGPVGPDGGAPGGSCRELPAGEREEEGEGEEGGRGTRMGARSFAARASLLRGRGRARLPALVSAA